MKFFKIVAVIGSLGLILASGAALGGGKGMTKTYISVEGLQFENPCTGEMIQLFGENMLLYRLEYDANGAEHLIFMWKMHTAGAIGLSTGTIYKAVGLNYGERSYITPDNTGHYYFTSRFGYVSHGPMPNWFQSLLWKIVVNANGDVVVDDTQLLEVECRG